MLTMETILEREHAALMAMCEEMTTETETETAPEGDKERDQ